MTSESLRSSGERHDDAQHGDGQHGDGQHRDGQHGDDGAQQPLVVGVLTDPDLPESVARRFPDVLPDLLTQHVNDRVSWTVDVVCEPFEAMAPDADRLIDKAKERVRNTNWNLAIVLTDLPMRDEGGDVVLAQISTANRVALISLPALGGFRLRRRAADLIVAIVDWLTRETTGESVAAADGPRLPRRTFAGAHATVLVPPDEAVAIEIVTSRRWGLPRLLAGMVRANRPWQLTLGLSAALAGALAGGAFGVLYSAIWQLGAALSPLRLAALTAGAIAALVIWLVIGHDLWERGPARDRIAGAWLRNAGTVLTLGFGALLFFLALFVITTTAAVVVIPPDYLATHIGRPVDWRSYLTVGLMAAVLGTVAGAVGSGLEDDATVRRATYGHRRQERWRGVRRDQG
jgi:hypothetical protein